MTDNSDHIKKLSVMLPHWIEHNADHAQEFREWAEGAESAARFLEQAAAMMEQVNLSLSSALDAVNTASASE
jgi:hypothetical protein